jgi:hypothetical protein
MSITPCRSFKSDTATFTGSFRASGLCTWLPKVSWSRTKMFFASSFRLTIL